MKTASGSTRFVYRGESGQRIRLTASFTNWDPYIYELNEKSPGIYELEIPLPKGTYYYKFIRGITEFIDTANPNRIFSADGQSASVFTVD
jgi:1,4-alpha-glucan branching enzyme